MIKTTTERSCIASLKKHQKNLKFGDDRELQVLHVQYTQPDMNCYLLYNAKNALFLYVSTQKCEKKRKNKGTGQAVPVLLEVIVYRIFALKK